MENTHFIKNIEIVKKPPPSDWWYQFIRTVNVPKKDKPDK